jgi:hypothetical protein
MQRCLCCAAVAEWCCKDQSQGRPDLLESSATLQQGTRACAALASSRCRFAHTFVALSRRLTLVSLPLPWMLLKAEEVRAEPCLLAACGAAVAGSMLGTCQACSCCGTAAVPFRQLQRQLLHATGYMRYIICTKAMLRVRKEHAVPHRLFGGLLFLCWCVCSSVL